MAFKTILSLAVLCVTLTLTNADLYFVESVYGTKDCTGTPLALMVNTIPTCRDQRMMQGNRSTKTEIVGDNLIETIYSTSDCSGAPNPTSQMIPNPRIRPAVETCKEFVTRRYNTTMPSPPPKALRIITNMYKGENCIAPINTIIRYFTANTCIPSGFGRSSMMTDCESNMRMHSTPNCTGSWTANPSPYPLNGTCASISAGPHGRDSANAVCTDLATTTASTASTASTGVSGTTGDVITASTASTGVSGTTGAKGITEHVSHVSRTESSKCILAIFAFIALSVFM